jgi:hypothetical protein
MITPKIKALFQFIEYLHSNIDNFNLNNELIQELELLKDEQDKLKPKKSFKDKMKFDELQVEIEKKFKILQYNTANPLKAKANELNVCNFDNEPIYSWFGIETEIRELKENFTESDFPEIFEHKRKYIEFRANSHKSFLSLAFFLNDLDEILKALFGFFNETEKNEFEAFESETIEVNNIKDAVELLIEGKSKISINPKFEPNLNDEYNDMFAVSNIKAKFVLRNGQIQHIMRTTKGTYDLENANLYDKETGEIVKKGTRINYNTDFLIQLNRLYILEVKPFLNHHFTNSNNRLEFFDYVKYAALNTEIIKHEGKKNAIHDWVRENEIELKRNPVSTTESTKSNEVAKEMHNHIFKGNAFELFKKYHSKMSLQQNSRTDLNLLFQLLKNDGLFVETVELKHYIKWLNETYGYDLTELKKVDINSKPNIQRTNVYKEYKQTTLK